MLCPSQIKKEYYSSLSILVCNTLTMADALRFPYEQWTSWKTRLRIPDSEWVELDVNSDRAMICREVDIEAFFTQLDGDAVPLDVVRERHFPNCDVYALSTLRKMKMLVPPEEQAKWPELEIGNTGWTLLDSDSKDKPTVVYICRKSLLPERN